MDKIAWEITVTEEEDSPDGRDWEPFAAAIEPRENERGYWAQPVRIVWWRRKIF